MQLARHTKMPATEALNPGHAVQDLRSPDILYRSLGCKLAVGMPFKDIATSDSILLREVPPADDGPARQALRRMAVRALFKPLSPTHTHNASLHHAVSAPLCQSHILARL